MAYGALWTPGQPIVRPGSYERAVSSVNPSPTTQAQGVLALAGKSSYGPLGSVQTIDNVDEYISLYGTSGTLYEMVNQAFLGGIRQVLSYRLGTGGSVATKTLQDTTGSPINAVRLDQRYPGLGKQYGIILRDSLTNPSTQRELLTFDGAVEVQPRITFTKGSTGLGEPQQLVAALAAQPTHPLVSTFLADGTKILATISAVSLLTVGTDPTYAAGDYALATAAFETLVWNALATDTEDATMAIQLTLQAYIDRLRTEGKRRYLVVGEPTSIALATRQTNSKAFNDPAVIYVGNGFKLGTVTYEGYKAVARAAAEIFARPTNEASTFAVIRGGTTPVNAAGELTNQQIIDCINSGMLVFTTNYDGQVQIEYGVNTLVTLGQGVDAGWKKIRRARTRDELWDRQSGAWSRMRVSNDESGRSAILQQAQAVVDQMIQETKLAAGTSILDPANASSGDSVYVATQNIIDLDGAEKIFGTLVFQF